MDLQTIINWVRLHRTSTVEVDQIEITAGNNVQVRSRVTVSDGEEIISQTYHRHMITPGDDYSGESEKVQAICRAIH